MQLRRTSGRACVRIGLVAVVAALAASPAALAVAEKPKPSALWKAFPLDPATKRPASPLLPPAQEGAETRAEATVTEQPSHATGEDYVALAFVALILLLTTVVLVSGWRVHVRRRQRELSVPLWQRLALPNPPDNARQLHQARVETSSSLVARVRRATESPPDVLAPRYRWSDRAPARRSPRSVGAELGMLLHRLRRVVWTEDTAPAIIGAVAAVVIGVLLVYMIG
jgi:uncharacterized iron-regulated membrane protein